MKFSSNIQIQNGDPGIQKRLKLYRDPEGRNFLHASCMVDNINCIKSAPNAPSHLEYTCLLLFG